MSKRSFLMPETAFVWQEDGGSPSESIAFERMRLMAFPMKVSQSVSRLDVWHDVQLSPRAALSLSHSRCTAPYPKMVYSDLISLQASIYAVHSYFPQRQLELECRWIACASARRLFGRTE